MASARRESCCYFCIVDDNYTCHLAAMLASLAENNSGFPVVVLHDGLSDANAGLLAGLAGDLGLDLRLVENRSVDLSVYGKCSFWPKSVWLKFHLDDFLPAGIERVIYLDADMIVLRPLDALFEADMGGKALAAVIDMQDADAAFKARLGIPSDGRYYNAGFMLIDVAAWKGREIGTRAARFARERPEAISYIDQCAFNAACWRDFLELPATWNQMVGYVPCDGELPHILHFAALKPWEERKTPGREFYIHYRNRTPVPFGQSPAGGPLDRLLEMWDAVESLVPHPVARMLGESEGHAVRRENRIRLRRWFRDISDVGRPDPVAEGVELAG